MDTNALTQEILMNLTPKAALIAYEHRNVVRADRYFVEMRPILADGTMGAGVPVTREFLRDIVENYAGGSSTTPSGIVPPNLLYADPRKGSERYIWYNLPRRRRMYFDKNLGIPDGDYCVPGVIYEAGENSLHVYAFTDDIPNQDTKLYYGPFFNTSAGSVCLGTCSLARPDSPSWHQLLHYWEDRFWRTKFTHLGGGENPTKGNLVLVTKAAANQPFDPEELKSSGKILKNLYS